MKKRVLIILDNGFDPDIRIYKEAIYLQSKGYEITIYCWDRMKRYKDKPIEFFNGIKIVRFFIYSMYGSGIKQAGALLKFALACRRALRNEEPYGYIHCSDLNGILVGVISGSKKRAGSRLIFDMKEFYEAGNLRRFRVLIRWLVCQMQDKSDWIVFLNERQKKEIKPKNEDKLVYLPNYPEKNKFPNTEKTYSECLRISFIGIVRHEVQLKALIDVAKDYPNKIHIYIYGRGVSYEALKQYAIGYENCYVTGEFDYACIYKLYQNTDILFFVYDSNDENDKTSYPTKFFEAIISHTPMIVAAETLHGQYCEENNLGFCISKNYAEDLRKIFDQILQDKKILNTMSENEYKLEKEYSWEAIVRNLDIIYN